MDLRELYDSVTYFMDNPNLGKDAEVYATPGYLHFVGKDKISMHMKLKGSFQIAKAIQIQQERFIPILSDGRYGNISKILDSFTLESIDTSKLNTKECNSVLEMLNKLSVEGFI